MALLIVELDKRIGNAQAWRDTFAEQIPELPIRIWPEANDLRDIEYLAFMHPDFDRLPAFPNLKAMFSRAAGVDDGLAHLLQHRQRAGEGVIASADHEGERAALRAADAARHRRVEHGEALLLGRGGDIARARHIDGR